MPNSKISPISRTAWELGKREEIEFGMESDPETVIQEFLKVYPEAEEPIVMVESLEEETKRTFEFINPYISLANAYAGDMNFDLGFPKSKRVGPDHIPPLYNCGRNESCPCGSGLKFKKCCVDKKSTDNNSSNTN